jgi:molybdopterin synthase sulfur carrier subunit
MPVITVQYFAILREQRGVSEERLTTSAPTAELLYEELCSNYGFTLPINRIRWAINGEFARSGVALKEGDRVVFIPPVAGG